MFNPGLVSFIIPTLNAEKSLSKCIKSILWQDYPQDKIEIIVVDSYSKDWTREISEKLGAKVYLTNFKPFGARYVGFCNSKGDFICFLDSDQILMTKDCVTRAVRLMDKYDMLNLEQYSLEPTTWIQKLYASDFRFIQSISRQMEPLLGVLYARFYKQFILKSVFNAIPKMILRLTWNHDDTILHYESLKVTNKLGVLDKAVWHTDVGTLRELWKKSYLYGKNGKQVFKTGLYDYAIRCKESLRFQQLKYFTRFPSDAVKSYLLLALKLIPFKIGELSTARPESSANRSFTYATEPK